MTDMRRSPHPFRQEPTATAAEVHRLGAAALLAYIEGAGESLIPPDHGPPMPWLDAWAARLDDDLEFWSPAGGGTRPDLSAFPWDTLAARIRAVWKRLANGTSEFRPGHASQPWDLVIETRARGVSWGFHVWLEERSPRR